MAGPWDSPKLVTAKRVPSVLPLMPAIMRYACHAQLHAFLSLWRFGSLANKAHVAHAHWLHCPLASAPGTTRQLHANHTPNRYAICACFFLSCRTRFLPGTFCASAVRAPFSSSFSSTITSLILPVVGTILLAHNATQHGRPIRCRMQMLVSPALPCMAHLFSRQTFPECGSTPAEAKRLSEKTHPSQAMT